MSGNAGFKSGSGSYASRDKQMDAYDRLPASVRAALANAAFDWAPYPIRRWFESGRMTAKKENCGVHCTMGCGPDCQGPQARMGYSGRSDAA